MTWVKEKVKARQTVAQATQQTKELGIVSEVPMGDWNATKPYNKLNLVRYNGATYIAKKANNNVAPATNNDVWQLLNADGIGLSTAITEYQAGESGTVPPTGDWVENIPTVPQGQYLWTKTIYNYTDGTQSVAYTVSLQVLGFTQADRDTIERITDAIPSSASETNPLATHDFVNSSINALAAFYITYNAQGDAFPTRASLFNATTFYQAGKVRVPTQNDYAIVQADESKPQGADGTYPTTRYSYQGGTYPDGQWEFQYIVNNTSLTQAQINAINSGITSGLVSQITQNKNDIGELTDVSKKNLYNEGSFDTFTSNGNGTGFVQRKTAKITKYNITKYNLNGQEPYPTFYIKSPILKGIIGNSQKNNFNFNSYTGENDDIHEVLNFNVNRRITKAELDEIIDKFVVEIELDTKYQYTDEVIENQPIRPANQEEEYYWHEEWQKGLNILNLDTIGYVDGQAIGNGGNPYADPTYYYVNYLKVEPNTNYTISTPHAWIAFYSAQNGADGFISPLLSSVNPVQTFTTPSNCNYIRLSNLKSNGYTIMITKGSIPYPYVPYYGDIVRIKKLLEEVSGLLKKSGGQMTGPLALAPDHYENDPALDCRNSHIVGVNAVVLADSDNGSGNEGFVSPRADNSSQYDSISLYNGDLYLTEKMQNLSDKNDGVRYKFSAMKETVVDASALDTNTWYPVTMKLPTVGVCHITVYNYLSNPNQKVSWSTHASGGIACLADWQTNAGSWGAGPKLQRNVYAYSWRWGDNPLGLISQMENSSQEYIYVRGGAKYSFYTSKGVQEPTLRTSDYTESQQTVAPTTNYPQGNYMETQRYIDGVLGAKGIRSYGDIMENNVRVYSPNNPPPLGDLDAAPKNHASQNTTYGAATSLLYGHVLLSTSSTVYSESDNTAITPKAVTKLINVLSVNDIIPNYGSLVSRSDNYKIKCSLVQYIQSIGSTYYCDGFAYLPKSIFPSNISNVTAAQLLEIFGNKALKLNADGGQYYVGNQLRNAILSEVKFSNNPSFNKISAANFAVSGADYTILYDIGTTFSKTEATSYGNTYIQLSIVNI